MSERRDYGLGQRNPKTLESLDAERAAAVRWAKVRAFAMRPGGKSTGYGL